MAFGDSINSRCSGDMYRHPHTKILNLVIPCPVIAHAFMYTHLTRHSMDICICVEIEHQTGKRQPPRESGAPTLSIYPSNNAILKSQHISDIGLDIACSQNLIGLK